MKTLTILRPDGTSASEEAPAGDLERLTALQKAVGGYIEVVRVTYKGNAAEAYVNEDGRRLQLPYNREASAMAMHAVLGNLVILEEQDSEVMPCGCVGGHEPDCRENPIMKAAERDAGGQ